MRHFESEVDSEFSVQSITKFFFIDNYYETIYSSFQKWELFLQGVEVVWVE